MYIRVGIGYDGLFLANPHFGMTQSSQCPGRRVLSALKPYHAKASFVIPFLPAVDKGCIVPRASYIRCHVISGLHEDEILQEYRSLIMAHRLWLLTCCLLNTIRDVVSRGTHVTKLIIVPLGLPRWYNLEVFCLSSSDFMSLCPLAIY